MIEKWTDLSEFLTQNQVFGSTPTRLDCGGSTDHRLTGLLCKFWQPATANIAIDLRAYVHLKSYRTGSVFIDIDGIGQQEFTAPHLPLTGPFALVSAVIYYFGVHGIHIGIKTDFPFQSGLGGSGAVAIALIGAIHAALKNEAPQAAEFRAMIQTAHNLEDSLFGNTGMQDQAAALYGGANLWEWKYDSRLDFTRRELLSDTSSLDSNILLAYTGRPHLQSQTGSEMLRRFKETAALDILISISEQARKFANLIECGDFRSAGDCLNAEYLLRAKLLPPLETDGLELIEMAENAHCGVSVTGRGGGGCIWAVGEKQDIDGLKNKWTKAFDRRKTGFLLPIGATNSGLEVSIQPVGEAIQTEAGRSLYD